MDNTINLRNKSLTYSRGLEIAELKEEDMQKKESLFLMTHLVDNSIEISNISFTSGDLLNIIKSINFIFEIDLE